MNNITLPRRKSPRTADFGGVVPVAIRRPRGKGPFPVITMGRGTGRGGLAHVEQQVERIRRIATPVQQRAFDIFMDFFDNHLRK